ncbi:aldehyde ferredoxin oxidoreductase family protein [Natronincola ferrireducens]|uniref:Aldehyde:ferredoxin oxidoreductase n=1 Tax=Natronincola ferrireducens TaxID=393762 RepID=A0A1G8YLG6_9FIRM|nr:aldehyde ferredoxin oxidoreductase family protein [Natronincola ferrireducens]SDK03304.1 aldehyde:ferredoxin oxidoreductase [Natronincola ferrireducens]
MLGYQNKVLRIFLDKNNIRVATEPLNMEWARQYIGGKGLGIKYLYEELKPGTDPLSSENKLILMTAPLTGTTVPCSGKLAIISRSPATGTILDCSIGGHIASEIKFAGYDAVIFEGALDVPSYIYIEDDKVRLLPADELWGKGSHDTEAALLQKYGRDHKILSIGPAGENLVSMACINSDYYRQAGRGGIGAVMGSKKIKAIVVKGSGSVKVANMKETLATINSIMRDNTLTDDNLWAYTDGTAMLVEMSHTTGILPTHNFQDGTFEGYKGIDSEAMKGARSGKKGCGSCALGCGNFTKIGNALVEGPEYETLALCGSNCGIGDLEAVVKFNQLCDDMGIDTISAGNTLAFAMELTEKGLKDFGLKFGDVEAYLSIPEMIAKKEGIGAELALGTKELGKRYGGSDFAMQVKGLEFPGYEPRGAWGMGLAYATSDRGACHMRAWPVAQEAYGDVDAFTEEGKAAMVIELQNYNAVKFSSILCDFWALDLEVLSQVLNAVTGESFAVEELDKIGERVVNIGRLFNQREGFSSKDDILPNRIFKDALKSGATAGKKIPKESFDKMLLQYYNERGWSQEGIIGEEKIQELQLMDLKEATAED